MCLLSGCLIWSPAVTDCKRLNFGRYLGRGNTDESAGYSVGVNLFPPVLRALVFHDPGTIIFYDPSEHSSKLLKEFFEHSKMSNRNTLFLLCPRHGDTWECTQIFLDPDNLKHCTKLDYHKYNNG